MVWSTALASRSEKNFCLRMRSSSSPPRISSVTRNTCFPLSYTWGRNSFVNLLLIPEVKKKNKTQVNLYEHPSGWWCLDAVRIEGGCQSPQRGLCWSCQSPVKYIWIIKFSSTYKVYINQKCFNTLTAYSVLVALWTQRLQTEKEPMPMSSLRT